MVLLSLLSSSSPQSCNPHALWGGKKTPRRDSSHTFRAAFTPLLNQSSSPFSKVKEKLQNTCFCQKQPVFHSVGFGSSLAETFQEKVQAHEMLLWVKSIQVIIWGCEEASENLRQKQAMDRVNKAVLWAPPVGRADQKGWSPVLLKVCRYGLWLLLFITESQNF